MASPVQARKAIRELALLPDNGEALELATLFARTAEYSSELLLRLWPTATDPDDFAEHLLAPAFVREGLTELRLRRMTSLRGLRHLTTLRTLQIDRCKEMTDLSDLGALTGMPDLTEVDLGYCFSVEDYGVLLGLPSLEKVRMPSASFRAHQGHPVPVIAELTARGVTVTSG